MLCELLVNADYMDTQTENEIKSEQPTHTICGFGITLFELKFC